MTGWVGRWEHARRYAAGAHGFLAEEYADWFVGQYPTDGDLRPTTDHAVEFRRFLSERES